MGQKKMVQNGYNPTLWQAEWNKQMTINQRMWEYSPDVSFQIPSGKLTFHYGKSPCLIGKPSISMGHL